MQVLSKGVPRLRDEMMCEKLKKKKQWVAVGCSAAISVTCCVVWPKLPESLPDGQNKLPQVKVWRASTAIVTVEGTQGLWNFHGSVSM